MNNAKIKCENCGQEITRERIALEGLIQCPVCDDILPRPDIGNGPNGGLKIRQNRSLNEGYQTCPSCDALNKEENTLCTTCGYNFVTGKKVKTVYQKKRDFSAWKNLILMAVTLAALTLAGWIYVNKPHQDNPEPAKPETTLQDQQQADFNVWKDQFDLSTPLLGTGDDVTLELTTGRILRGQILDLDDGKITLFTALGRESIPLETLTETSRVQVSIASRRAYIEDNQRRIFGE